MATEKRLHLPRFTGEQARKIIFESLNHLSDSDDDDIPCSDDSETEYIPVPDDDVDANSDAEEQSPEGDVSGASDTEQSLADDGASQDSDDIAGAQPLLDLSSNQDEMDLIARHLLESKNGKEVWMKTPYVATGRQPSQNVMKQVPGPTAYARRNADTKISALELFITKHIARTIVKWSNEEGLRVFGDDWIPIDDDEFHAYLGLLYLAGVYRSNGESTEELWHPVDGRKIFRAVMSLKRFKALCRILRFDDKTARQTGLGRNRRDRLSPIRDIFESWVVTLSQSFIPYENVTVDEQLVGFRGHCPFRQYIKSKPAKYGIKVWALCDSSTSYALNMQVYTGKRDGEPPEKNQGERVVRDMIEVIAGSGRNVTMDNFFTSVTLARQLLTKKLSLVGTLRKNKGEIPVQFLPKRDRDVNETLFGHQQSLTLVSYVPKRGRSVILLSSMHKDAQISNREDKKPQIILDYNHAKGGVDTLDQMVGTYSTKRKTRRWPLVLFFNIMDVSAVNAFIIWSHLNPEWNSNKSHRRRLFLKQLGKDLVRQHMMSRLSVSGLSLSLKKAIEECIQENDDSTDDAQDDAVENTEEVHKHGHDAAYSDAPRKRKQGRCVLCDRSKDKKARTSCHKCGCFACADHIIALCTRCAE